MEQLEAAGQQCGDMDRVVPWAVLPPPTQWAAEPAVRKCQKLLSFGAQPSNGRASHLLSS